jgi:hypothetical protein
MDDKNYSWFNEKVRRHKGNIGLLTGGESRLVVLDFDDESYFNACEELPLTFTVLTAKKGMKHLYYYLKGDSFRYFGIDRYVHSTEGVVADLNSLKAIEKLRQSRTPAMFQAGLKSANIRFKRVCDVMADGGRVICPGSIIDGKYYYVLTDMPIQTITKEHLMKALGLQESDFRCQKPRARNPKSNIQHPEKVEQAIKALEHIGLKRSNTKHFNCLRHGSEGGMCLHVMDDGKIYCFHEKKCWFDVHSYIDDAIAGGFLK